MWPNLSTVKPRAEAGPSHINAGSHIQAGGQKNNFFVLIEAGSRLQDGSRIQAGGFYPKFFSNPNLIMWE